MSKEIITTFSGATAAGSAENRPNTTIASIENHDG